jgi:hypothetical protein
MELLTLLLAFFALLASCGAFYLAQRALSQVAEPIELRRQLVAYDEALSEHESRLRAYYARLRKRDKTLSETLAPAQEELAQEDAANGNGLGGKAELWRRAQPLMARRRGG